MKKYGKLIGIMVVTLSCLTAVAASLEKPEDDSIVDIIKQYSNLTDRDVKKIKLVRLRILQEPVAGSLGATAVAAGGYGAYKAHGLAGTVGSKMGEYAQGFYKPDPKLGTNLDLIKNYVPESLINLVSNKWAWAIAGAVGIGIGSYKFLYPRLERSILNRIKIFVDMCENLDVYSFNYAAQHAQYPNSLAEMGSSRVNQFGAKYKSEWLPVNTAWVTSNIARAKGIENLRLQAGVAVKLLAELPDTEEVENLRGRVGTIMTFLKKNEPLIVWSAQQEQNERDKLDAQQVGAQQRVAKLGLVKAQADVEKEKTRALWWAKVMGVINAVPHAVKKTAETLTYIYDNKEKIVGGVVAIYFLPSIGRVVYKGLVQEYGGK